MSYSANTRRRFSSPTVGEVARASAPEGKVFGLGISGLRILPRCHSVQDNFQHSVEIFVDISVPKPQHEKDAPAQIRVTPRVIGNLFFGAMRAAVDLDHKTNRQTCEIGYVGTDRVLPSKASASNGIAPQPRPKYQLRSRIVALPPPPLRGTSPAHGEGKVQAGQKRKAHLP